MRPTAADSDNFSSHYVTISRQGSSSLGTQQLLNVQDVSYFAPIYKRT